MSDKVKLSVFRKDPDVKGDIGKFVEYEVPIKEGMVVLDAVRYVEENIDTTLAVRWNCKAARCGSCAAEINNRPALMCKTRIDLLGDKIKVAPMAAFPLVKDIVTDVSENFEIDRRIPAFQPRPGLKSPWIIAQMDVERTKEFRKCIECFLCMDVCHVVREHKEPYVGPRHVIKAASVDMHPMDTLDRSAYLNKEGGLGYCNITKCCQEVCPEGIKITDNAIIQEKERAVDNSYDPIAMFFKKRGKKKGGV
ncbi:MAG: succinate dehydrogenase/fumarate reductase iron-sulfur subunit [Candidatus Marsarchaeota archaeon]|nr:succinate dehydrogenase/fumarate reductase iron-sulfur subunit [Candidatus Marsarchaeota archaeon]